MSLNDKLCIPPRIHPISTIQVPDVIETSMEGVPVFKILKEDCGVVLIDLVFYAGRPQETCQLASSVCAPMMREGAGVYNSEELSEEVDFMGATISVSSSLDLITARMICLKKYLPAVADLMGQVLSAPHFDTKEFEHFIQRRVERLQHELSKNDVISYRELTASIYGDESPYGYNSSPEKYKTLSIEGVINHYERTIKVNNCVAFVAGDVSPSDHSIIEQLISQIPSGGLNLKGKQVSANEAKPRQKVLTGNPMQSSIKLGRRGINRKHEDYYSLNFLNTLFGGFFGSRLVTNIREQLGMTYGIYSMLDQQLLDGSLIISTEVTNENVQACIDEIHKEMKRLQEEIVKEEEIQLVKNYMMGNFLNLFDGPFNSLKAIKSLVLSDIPLDNLSEQIMSSVSIKAEEVLAMAQKYFNKEDYWEVVVGTPLV